MRLDKYLSNAGLGSRKDVKNIISSGRVTVNGTPVKDGGFHITEADDVVCAGNAVLNHTCCYIMMNKPKGVITATEDASQKTVVDLLPAGMPKGLSPVGRLDIDTVGLLLITNDGVLAHRLISPKSQVDKVYYVRTDAPLSRADVDSFASSITLKDGTRLLPAILSIDKDDDHAGYVTISEGKYHQVKRMFAACNNRVTYLKRISFGPLSLDESLPEGAFRELTDDEISLLKDL